MNKIYTADFETTTISPASVWAWGICDIDSPENIIIDETIDSFFEWCKSSGNSTLYFHNLKFDGNFILHYLLTHGFTWKQDKKLCSKNDFTTIISDDGKFYQIVVYFIKSKKLTKKVTFLDSMKIINMSVAAVAKAFGLKLKKGSIDYNRHNIKCSVTDEEKDYLKNDVQIMAYALKQMFSMGFDKMTIGSCALSDYKNLIGEKQFNKIFPKLTLLSDSKIRMSYKGGYTNVCKENQCVDIGEGLVFDVNSLYPYVMHDKPLPYGEPLEFEGKYVKNKHYPLYIQNFRCFFKIKKNKLPTIQLKHTPFFSKTEYLESSVNKITGENEYIELSLTCVDFEIFLEHYDVSCIQYLGGYMFKQSVQLFAEWIDKWNAEKIKADAEGNKGKRTIAKLMMNNLYGKFALNPNVKSKYPYLDTETNIVKYKNITYDLTDENGNIIYNENGEPKKTDIAIRDTIYIPVGTFITAWARYTTITAAQKIHEESILKAGKSRYCYSDTDSIHISGTEIPDCIDVHPRNLGKWKHESSFKRARFLQSKRYIEDEYIVDSDGNKIINENGEPETKLKITCAGMPDACYKYVTWDNFKQGTKYKGKLNPKTVEGGVILIPVEFSMNKK